MKVKWFTHREGYPQSYHLSLIFFRLWEHPHNALTFFVYIMLYSVILHTRFSSTWDVENLTSISLPKYLNLLDHWTIAICFLIQIYSIMCCMLVVTNENLKYSLNRQINLSSTTQIHCLYTLTVLLHITSLLYYLTMVLHDFRIKWDKNLDVMLW